MTHQNHQEDVMLVSPSRIAMSLAVGGVVVLAPVVAAQAAPTSSEDAAPTSTFQTRIDQQLRSYPGGMQVAPNVVEYKGGAVRVIFGTAAEAAQGNAEADRNQQAASPQASGGPVSPQATTYVHGCPRGASVKWFCFYSESQWNENADPRNPNVRMVQFRDPGLQSLVNYGFNDVTSSWVNTTTRSVSVYNNSNGSGLLWTEGAGSSSSYVGNANDAASSFRS